MKAHHVALGAFSPCLDTLGWLGVALAAVARVAPGDS